MNMNSRLMKNRNRIINRRVNSRLIMDRIVNKWIDYNKICYNFNRHYQYYRNRMIVRMSRYGN